MAFIPKALKKQEYSSVVDLIAYWKGCAMNEIVEKYLEKQCQQYVVPMEGLLADLATEIYRIELRSLPSQEATSLYTGYKLRNTKGTKDRTLILLVDDTQYVSNRGNWSFSLEAGAQIKAEIRNFWTEGNTERLRIVYIPTRA